MRKADRWKAIAAGNTESAAPSRNKPELIATLGSVQPNPTEESTDKEGVDSGSISSKDTVDSGVDSRSMNKEYKDGVVKRPPVDLPSVSPVEEITSESPVENTGFSSRINRTIEDSLRNKQTKEDTHKKTSFLLRKDTLKRLRAYDNYMKKEYGRGSQGALVNYLLDNYFRELIEADPAMKEMLDDSGE